MIDVGAVSDAVLELLTTAVGEPGRLHTAPAGSPVAYFVVQRPPGGARDGSLGDPDADLLYRFRLLAVVRHTDIAVAGRASEELAGRLAAAVLDRATPLVGDGWEVTGREQVADGGTDTQGGVANATADFELLVAASRTPPGSGPTITPETPPPGETDPVLPPPPDDTPPEG